VNVLSSTSISGVYSWRRGCSLVCDSGVTTILGTEAPWGWTGVHYYLILCPETVDTLQKDLPQLEVGGKGPSSGLKLMLI
jgi:hypothetical protein